MKLKSTILATAFFALGVSSVQSADTRTPDILSSVSSSAVQVLTKAESADVRGEYLRCFIPTCWTEISETPLQEYLVTDLGGRLLAFRHFQGQNAAGFYVSR